MTHQTTQDTIHASLDALQYGATERFIVFHPVPCGLGGQITGRVQTLALALLFKRKAVFLTETDPPYAQTFAALSSHVTPGLDFTGAPALKLVDEQKENLVCYNPLLDPIAWNEIHGALLQKANHILGLSLSNWHELEGHVFNWMRLTDEMQSFCNAERERLGVSGDTLGVHFRRGDKAVETAFVPSSVFNDHIAAIYKTWKFKSVFLASDSPAAPLEIKVPPGVKLIFDEQESRFNNANHKMLMSKPELAPQETRVAFKNIALLAACGGIIGQDNAHFATLAAGSILARGGSTDRVVLVDGRIAEIKSPLLSAFFRTKKLTRSLARVLFPWLTTAARMKRRA